MRKRELEKLLYKAVADALGVDIEPARRNAAAEQIAARKPRRNDVEAHPQQRAA